MIVDQVARETNPTQECDTFVDVNQMVTCDKHAFKAFLSLADGRYTLYLMQYFLPIYTFSLKCIVKWTLFELMKIGLFTVILKNQRASNEMNFFLQIFAIENEDIFKEVMCYFCRLSDLMCISILPS